MGSNMILSQIESVSSHTFIAPVKKIHDGPDVTFFLTSLAYRDLIIFILQLNRSVVPTKISQDGQIITQAWQLGSDQIACSEAVKGLQRMIEKLELVVQEVPPDTGPRRFGNVSFRKWNEIVQQRTRSLLQEILRPELEPALDELEAYLIGSFGSQQRLDYGTGHELSFIAFLACLWKLSYFDIAPAESESRGIVLVVFEAYLRLIRLLIKTYTLEPAGSHGVWGLDDNSFLPYMFGSAQFSPAISQGDDVPTEASLPDSPDPNAVTKLNVVEREKARNMYFSAIAFIYDVKRGPFWEHSPMLYDISGIKDGWGKINKGMIKMYNAEVLSKFPVVQHFPFGSLFTWEKDPEAKAPPTTAHASNQPLRNPAARPHGGNAGINTTRPPPPAPVGFANGVTKAPWASRTPAPPPPGPRGRDPRAPG
jgi:serine/threonine-protein phosphatase 2A activator